MNSESRQINVSLVAIPDAMLSTLTSMYDALNSFDLVPGFEDGSGERGPFRVEIVASDKREILSASGLSLSGHRTLHEVERTDIVIIPSVKVAGGNWETGRYPAMLHWLSKMYAEGALMCSACSGVLLLAETGLLDGHEATIHWAYTETFRSNFPSVRLRADKVLVASGNDRRFVMSGASASWHDLILYLVARHVGPGAAQAVARFMLLQWHPEGQAPYAMFVAPTDHGDAVVLAAQEWLDDHFSQSNPVEQMVTRSGLAERTFKRRFKKATGFTPISYVQHLRIETAKRRLEGGESPVDQVSWEVGYEDPAFFRRLFKRMTGITPGAYRRKFRLPALDRWP